MNGKAFSVRDPWAVAGTKFHGLLVRVVKDALRLACACGRDIRLDVVHILFYNSEIALQDNRDDNPEPPRTNAQYRITVTFFNDENHFEYYGVSAQEPVRGTYETLLALKQKRYLHDAQGGKNDFRFLVEILASYQIIDQEQAEPTGENNSPNDDPIMSPTSPDTDLCNDSSLQTGCKSTDQSSPSSLCIPPWF